MCVCLVSSLPLVVGVGPEGPLALNMGGVGPELGYRTKSVTVQSSTRSTGHIRLQNLS